MFDFFFPHVLEPWTALWARPSGMWPSRMHGFIQVVTTLPAPPK